MKLKNVEFISWKEYDTIKKSNMPFEELNINDGNKWFTDIYFTKLKSFIKSYLTINPIYKPLLQKYDTKSGIAIHYRLGDKIEMNLQHPKIMYVVMKPEYFIDNCKKMLQEKPGPIYIFSDSHYLVKCILKELKEAIYVNIGYIETFYLLTKFKRLIISESTLSIGAALLNKSAKQIVVPNYYIDVTTLSIKKHFFSNNNMGAFLLPR